MTRNVRIWIVVILGIVLFIGSFGLAGAWFGIELGDTTYAGWIGAAITSALALAGILAVVLFVVLLLAVLEWIDRGDW